MTTPTPPRVVINFVEQAQSSERVMEEMHRGLLEDLVATGWVEISPGIFKRGDNQLIIELS